MVIPGFYPAIIDQELLHRVHEKLKSEKDSFCNAFAHRTEYLLSRLVVCDFCGYHYVGASASRENIATIHARRTYAADAMPVRRL